ncbi:hypothetical protein C5167_021382 [Papaver somniferum]|uniref:beta-galactosidase n=1 Tax=Papaver somniferum TaxID=3469 RepID=A0A4Y7IVR8_PAPSO|nr:hypothetical protein C5167_021382 [Papaver somniferum]
MVHGGTNFGFLNGANTGSDDSDFKPDITSYDYDAPISEWGDSDSAKFKALRKVIKKYSPISVPRIPPNNGKRGHGKVKLQKRASPILRMLLTPEIQEVLHGWKMIPFYFENLSKLFKESPIVGVATSTSKKEFSRAELLSEGPMLYEGHFTINSTDEVAGTFISFSGWGKGVAFVTDFNIGRFWPLAGPQCSLNVPAPLLQPGKNVVLILETDAPNHELVIESIDQQDFTCGQRSRVGTK